ncbi:MAG: CpaF family protein [Clostridia bacterium]|nr:CpaF family protein [Clostridia bacterium]
MAQMDPAMERFLFRNREPDSERSYDEVLSDVQSWLVENHAAEIAKTGSDRKQVLLDLIRNYLSDRQITVSGFSTEALIGKLYEYMAGYAFLRKYLSDPDVEEIDINAWDDVEVIYSGEHPKKVRESFSSPEQSLALMRRLLTASELTVDSANPSVVGTLEKGIRIAVCVPPVVDEETGVAASIRVVGRRHLSKEDLLRCETVNEPIWLFLNACMQFGPSFCVSGATNSGKTSLLDALLAGIPDNRRIITIEDGSREFDLRRNDRKGRAKNSVVHLLTRRREFSDLPDITQDYLLERVLRMNPDVIAVGEIRAASECMAVAEASRTGHLCATTIHASSARDTYLRMMTLAKRKNDLSDGMLLRIMAEAFPVIVFLRQLPDGTRKVMEVAEGTVTESGEIHQRTLFRYKVDENISDGNGGLQTKGHFEQCSRPSERILNGFLENGASRSMLGQMEREGSS